MSVLECNRENCQNIMCDRYSSEFGYICNECFNELILWMLRYSDESPMEVIRDFMDSEKGNIYPCEMDVFEYVNDVFPMSD